MVHINMIRSVLGRDGYISVVTEEGRYVCDGRQSFDCPDKIVDLMRNQVKIDQEPEEHLYIFGFDIKQRIMGMFQAAQGGSDTCPVPVREILIKLLGINAAGFLMVHNHPSGDCTPSELDKNITTKIKNAGDAVGIEFLDSIIVANYGGYFSFKQEGLL